MARPCTATNARAPAGRAGPPRMGRGAPMAWAWQPGHRSRRGAVRAGRRSMETLAVAEAAVGLPPYTLLCARSAARVPCMAHQHRSRPVPTSPGLPPVYTVRMARPAPWGARTFNAWPLIDNDGVRCER